MPSLAHLLENDDDPAVAANWLSRPPPAATASAAAYEAFWAASLPAALLRCPRHPVLSPGELRAALRTRRGLEPAARHIVRAAVAAGALLPAESALAPPPERGLMPALRRLVSSSFSAMAGADAELPPAGARYVDARWAEAEGARWVAHNLPVGGARVAVLGEDAPDAERAAVAAAARSQAVTLHVAADGAWGVRRGPYLDCPVLRVLPLT